MFFSDKLSLPDTTLGAVSNLLTFAPQFGQCVKGGSDKRCNLSKPSRQWLQDVSESAWYT